VKEANAVIYRSANIADEEKRSYSDLIVVASRAYYPYRETVTKENAKLALPARSLYKPQYRTQGPPQGNVVLVFWRWYFQTVEVISVSLVDPWQMYVPFAFLYLTPH
jgi:hypothetical protein